MSKLTRTTPDQKAAYRGVYPLYGYIATEEGIPPIVVEDLRGSWSRPDPVWEAVAPGGCSFSRSLRWKTCSSV